VAQSSTNVRPAVTMKDLRVIASRAGWDPQQWDLDRHLSTRVARMSQFLSERKRVGMD